MESKEARTDSTLKSERKNLMGSPSHLPSIIANTPAKNGSGCPSNKRSFRTSIEADTFARQWIKEHPGAVAQDSYACEECPNWHLSTMTTEAHAMSRSNL